LAGQWDLWNFVIHDIGSQIISGLLIAAMGQGLRKSVTIWRRRRNDHGRHDAPPE
jgi:hypothetical protein